MRYLILPFYLGLLGCAPLSQIEPAAEKPEPDPVATPAPPPPPSNARTVEQFDTTTAEQRDAATAPSEAGRLLGTEIVSLGDASVPGFWLETPLVKEPGKGKLVFNGNSVEVDLRPGASSRASLAALRVLEAPLTDLSEIKVYAH